MELRLSFDTIPEQFEKWRPHYIPELFSLLIKMANVGKNTKVLEIGPGTGQATDPILETGCDYTAIELGSNLSEFLRNKYKNAENYSLINDDFITHDFGDEKYDMIYSAAAIQWLPEDTAFSKTFRLLKSGGMLAMMFLHMDLRSPQPQMYADMQKVYDKYFKTEKNSSNTPFVYDNALDYGYTDLETHIFRGTRAFTAEEYVQYIGTHSDHIALEEPYRTPFFEGIKEAITRHGNKLVINDEYILKTVKKP
jgi:ubiquinone/menaquinone biosynthesis C-methylase UbiE